MTIGRPASQSTLGPYRILAPLDRGGVGEVYRAWDPRLQREIALKILHDRSDADPERLRQFVAEARAASALNHPNIVTVFDAAVDGDTPFIVSELIDGRTLREELRGAPMPLKRVLDFATQIADGLAAAHDAGIVHRDLKPENIMIARTGRVKLIDFGLARTGGWRESGDTVPTDHTQTQTAVGLRAGTVPYMSPEQARGLSTDIRTDQFSFGLILYEMATGRAAFRRDTPAATLDAIINDDPPPDAALDARAPAPLRWVIDRCLAKDPDERYAVTADLYRELRMLRDRLAEVSVRDLQSPMPVGRDRRKAWLAIVAAALAAAVIVLALAARFGRPVVAPAEPRFAPLATGPGYEGLPAWSPDGLTIAYAADVDDTLQIFTRRLSASTAAQVTRAPYDCKHPFWSPDGKRIYYVSLARERESLWSIGAAGGTPQVVIENATRGAISPDGHVLAFLRDEERGDIVGASALWLASPVGADQRRYEKFDPLRINEGALAFSPDGATLGLSIVPRSIGVESAGRGWQFWTVPVGGGRPVRKLQSFGDAAPRVTGFSWLPDGRHVVLGLASLSTPGSHLWIADLDRNRAWSLTRGPGSESFPSVSPQGDQVVFGSGDPDYDVVEVPLDGGSLRPLLETTRNESDPVWSPDGAMFAYVTDRGGQDEIWLRSRDGLTDRPLITQRDFGDDRTIMLSSPSFSPDGRRIAYQRNASKPIWPLRIWISQTQGGPPVPLLPPAHEGYQGAPSWSPDGQWIAYTEWKDQKWMLAKARVGSDGEPIVLRSDGVSNAAPSWSPDGEWITWETEGGLLLAALDGGRERRLSDGQMLAHTWSRNGAEIVGIRETEQLRLSLIRIDVRTGQERAVVDLGPAPAVNNAVKGISVTGDGRAIATSIVRLRGDLWLLQNLAIPAEAGGWFARPQSQ